MSSRPTVQLSRRFTFSAAHRLHNAEWSEERNRDVFGKCNNANGHGHNYTVLVYVRGPVDEESGMVVNLSDVKTEIAAIDKQLDHKHLDRDVPYFAKVVSTTENVAVFIYDELKKSKAIGCILHKVEVWETENNKFVYKGQK